MNFPKFAQKSFLLLSVTLAGLLDACDAEVPKDGFANAKCSIGCAGGTVALDKESKARIGDGDSEKACVCVMNCQAQPQDAAALAMCMIDGKPVDPSKYLWWYPVSKNPLPMMCTNGQLDYGETDKDCGGSCGPSCGLGQKCLVHGDCKAGNPDQLYCDKQNTRTCIKKKADGMSCVETDECLSMMCTSGVCGVGPTLPSIGDPCTTAGAGTKDKNGVNVHCIPTPGQGNANVLSWQDQKFFSLICTTSPGGSVIARQGTTNIGMAVTTLVANTFILVEGNGQADNFRFVNGTAVQVSTCTNRYRGTSTGTAYNYQLVGTAAGDPPATASITGN